MTELKVDYHALGAMATRLNRAKDALEHTKDQVFSYDGSLGSSNLKDAMHSFVNKWSDGRDEITKDLTQAVGFLNGAVESYSTNEHHKSQEFTDSAGS